MRYSAYIKPGSKKGPLVEIDDNNQMTVYVRDKAIDGKANIAVIETVAKHFKKPKTYVQIVRGHSSRYKIIDVEDDK